MGRTNHQSPLWLTICCGLALLGCADGSNTRGDGGASSCTNDLTCDDGFPCTIDTCGVGNVCVYEAIDERCDTGQTCEVGRGCVSTSSCMSNDDCDDAFDCTTDTCGVGGICNHTPVNERCADGETCEVEMGCVEPEGCDSAAECDDGVSCTLDSCTVDRTCSNTPEDSMCDMGAGEVCSGTSGCVVPMDCTDDTDCDDGVFCNGTETCNLEFGGCETEPRVCNDSDDCTVDSCDSDMDMCIFNCDTSRPECECPTTGPSCLGTFNISPAPIDRCAGDMVDYDLSQVVFTQPGGRLVATPTRAHFTQLTDMMAPICPSFVATATVSGGTPESFTLQGTFTDDDTFMGAFTADYGGIGTFVGCNEGTTMVTGTRAP